MRGRLIVLEGLDGTGKSTLARGLARRMGAVLLSTPGAALHEVRRTIDEAYRDLPIAMQLFYASTVVAAGAQAQSILGEGRDVVCDRYWLSTWVYAKQRGARIDLEGVERSLPAAAVTLLCEVDEQVRAARMLDRGATPSDRMTLLPERAQALRQAYREALTRPVAGRGVLLDLTQVSPRRAVEAALSAVGPRRTMRLRDAA